MKPTTLITLVLSAVALALAYYLGNTIHKEQSKFELIIKSEDLIKDNLKGLREAQVIHKKKYGNYAPNWNKLSQFIAKDTLYLTDRSEIIISRQYKEDSIIVRIDTVGRVSVSDSLFGNQKYATLDKNTLSKIPLQDHDFVMVVKNDSTTKDDFLYIGDENPLDKMRRKPIIRNDKVKKIKGTKPLLSIGSKTDESLNVSWTK